MPIPPFEEAGIGPALLLGHGTMMDRTMFADQLAGLSDTYRVVAFDHRARTENWRGPYDLDDLADDVVALLNSLDIERCVLGGMSMGGFMALRFALRHQDRLDGLVLIDTMAAAPVLPTDPAIIPAWPNVPLWLDSGRDGRTPRTNEPVINDVRLRT